MRLLPRPTFGKPPAAAATRPPAASGETHTAKGVRRRAAMLAEVAATLPTLPGPGEAVHFLLDRRWEMANIVVSLCTQPGRPKVEHLRIATLSVGLKQLKSLLDLADAGTVGKLTLIVSHYFANADKEIHARLVDEFAKRGFKTAAPRCHAKVVTLAFADGTTLVTEGSANLRANKNFEQVAVINDDELHHFHARWIDTIVEQNEKA